MITVIGSSNVDYITYNKKLPVPGETVYGESMSITGGGKGANQAAAVARLGAPTCLLTKIGDDNNAKVLTDALKWAGVDLSHIEVVEDEFCGTAFVTVGENAQNFITIHEGANKYISPEFIEKNRSSVLQSKICMAEFGVPMDSVEYGMKLARDNGIMTMLNPAPVFSIDELLYKQIDIITPNEIEVQELTGIVIDSVDAGIEAAHYFHSRGVGNVIITLGSRGSFVSDGKESRFIKSYNVEPVDTTGAGDSFIGGIAYALWNGRNLFEAADFATAVAASSIMRSGSMISMPTLEEVMQLQQQSVK